MIAQIELNQYPHTTMNTEFNINLKLHNYLQITFTNNLDYIDK